MPLYEYECQNGHRFEVIQKFSDPPLDTCTTCGAPVRKLVASPAFQFKGTGWYITDYAKKDGGGGKASSSDSSSAPAAEKAETKTESPAKSDAAPAASDSKA